MDWGGVGREWGLCQAYFTSEKGREETHTQPAAFHAMQRNHRPNLIHTVGKKKIQALTPVRPQKMRFSKLRNVLL